MGLFKSILVLVDSAAETQHALDAAARLAKDNDANLTVADVIPDLPWAARFLRGGHEQFVDDIREQKIERLEKLVQPIKADGVRLEIKVLHGRTSLQAIREVIRSRHDLVVKDTKGRRSNRTGFFGTTATNLLRKCPCAVWLVKPDQPVQCRRIVACVNSMPGDELHAALNAHIMRIATQVCDSRDCNVSVVTVWNIYGESILKDHMRPDEFEELEARTEAECERYLDDLLVKFSMGVGSDSVAVLRGDPTEQIPKYVDESQPDLLVLGSVGRSGVAGFLIGNIAEHVLGKVQCSVLAVKPSGFVSPIRA